jgi:putative endonuclease
VPTRAEIGRSGEAVAEAYLRARHFRIVAKNFRCRAGEIDLVARDGGELVFVEVRSRRGGRTGTALESVTAAKQLRVARVARYYLAAHGLADVASRFDVLGVDFAADPPIVEHVRGAFEVGG